MLQRIKFSDITSVTTGIIVHGCNAQGKMNSGVAKAIRDKWPANYEKYKKDHETVPLQLGEVIFHKVDEHLIIANAIIQEYYGKDGRKYVSYGALHTAFQEVAREASRWRMSVHYPMIGGGLGGGNWSIIQPILDSVFDIHPAVQRTLWIMDEWAS